MTYRNTIANMMAEAEAQNGIFAADDESSLEHRKLRPCLLEGV